MERLDIEVSNHGTIYLIQPLTPTARAWLADNVGPEAQYLGTALAVEPRYAGPLLEGMAGDGLTLGRA